MKLKLFYLNQSEIPEQFASLYEEIDGQWKLTGVEGMKTQSDIDRVMSALNKERDAHKAVKQTLAKLGDRSVDEILADIDRIEEYKLSAGKIDETKLNELVEARLKSRVGPIQRERDQSVSRLKELEELVSAYETKEKTRTIHDAMRAAIGKSTGFIQSAAEDALMYASVFEIDDRGAVVTKENSGVTPGVDPSVWLSEMSQRKPHWWAASQGGGAKGGSAGNSVANPWAKDSFNMTEQARIYRENPERAAQLAKSAGASLF